MILEYFLPFDNDQMSISSATRDVWSFLYAISVRETFLFQTSLIASLDTDNAK